MSVRAFLPKTAMFLTASLLTATALFSVQQTSSITSEEATAIGIDAYIFGYPLVTMDKTREVLTNVVIPEQMKAPMGQFANARTYPNASFNAITAPNADTLYSEAWLDLSKEPYILHLPQESERYYLMPILDAWTNVFADPGTRTTGTKVQDFAITGPHWKGILPQGVKELKSSTDMVWILGRTYCTGTPEDYKAVHEIQDQYALTPLSFYGKPYTPPEGKVDSSIDMKTAVRNQVNQMKAGDYFKKLASLMKNNPPSKEDAAIVNKMALIGLIPGEDFDIDKVEKSISSGLEKVPKLALEKIAAHSQTAGVIENGWVITLKTGLYGIDYLQRAFITLYGLGANRPEDAIYPSTKVDSTGKLLDGANRYVINFPNGQTPPAEAFWSLTMYDENYFFVENPLNRYTLSPRDKLKYNQDGSLDLYIQNESPSRDKEANWLPAPQSKFVLMLRIYWPKESLLNGTWKPPAVQQVAAESQEGK